MRALVWILIWIVLVLGAAWYLWAKLRVGWRTSRELAQELRVTEARLNAVQQQVQQLGETSDTIQQLAVFGDPAALRTERERTRETLAGQRRARRAGNRPSWARRVDS